MTLKILFAIFIIFQISGEIAKSDQLPRSEVERLVKFDPLYNKSMTYEEWRMELRTRPGIIPDILAMINHEMDEGNGDRNLERMGKALAALQERADLNPGELASITDRLRKFSIQYDPKDQLANWFISPGLPILKHYPSPENEDLALRFLNFRDSSFDESAVITLAAIGTERSLVPLKEFANRVKPAPGNPSARYDATMDALRSIERRAQEKQRNENQRTDGKVEPKKSEADQSRTGNAASVAKQWPLLAVAIALLAASLGYLKWRKAS